MKSRICRDCGLPSGAKARVFLGFDGAAESRALSKT